MNVHFSSKTDDWATPQDFFDQYKHYCFDVDVCATKENAKVAKYWTKEDDGLKQDWTNLVCWMNPPYGREIGKWVEKASTSGAKQVICLLPARTDTRWFHEYILGNNATVRFIKGRLKFGGSKNSAPFPSMVVIFDSPTNTDKQ